MVLEQFYLNCLAHASYLVGDTATGTAVVVDPQRDIDRYLEAAARHGLAIRYVFLTHFHADFLAGHLELRDRAGATICLGAQAQADYAFRSFSDGEVLDLGRVRLQILETPGHTIESICLLVYDLDSDPTQPYAVLTGDTLFIGDVGRPDLRASLGWAPEALARLLFRSLRTKLLTLPDRTLVYPAHGAGSLCGRSLSTETVSTIGTERRFNYALQPLREDDFVRLVTADQPDAPSYFTYDAVLNAKERPTLDDALRRGLNPLDLDTVLALQAEGAQVLDVREPVEFARAHLAGSLNIGLSGPYATWAGTLLDRERPVVLIAEPGREHEAAVRLGRIGFDIVKGYLDGGIAVLERRPEVVDGTERVTASEAAALLEVAPRPTILDVRTPHEWERKRITGSLNVPLNRLPGALETLPRQGTLLLLCAGGYRSSIAASLLQRHGFTGLLELAGGIAAWEAAGFPLDRPANA